MAIGVLGAEADRAADAPAARRLLEQLAGRDDTTAERLELDGTLRSTVAVVGGASPYLSRLCLADGGALDVLADLDRRPRPGTQAGAPVASIARFKQRELLRLAARDLTGIDDLDAAVAGLSRLADDILVAACDIGAPGGGLAVVAMGKLGAEELNYASDIDVLLVGDADPRPVLDLARSGWKVDLGLRPEGRSGPLVRTLASYLAYWDRWAETWEFQAMLKARPAAGDGTLAAAWAAEAAERVWGRQFGADELRQVRDMKRRAETDIARRGLSDRELKRGRGGLRDIEFAVQLLQMVHGRSDPELRVRATLPALRALAAGGYIAADDAAALAEAYRWLRAVEHRIQLVIGEQAHSVPRHPGRRRHLARVLGFRDRPQRPAVAQFDEVLRGHQATVRALHERLFFRPLLESFTGTASPASHAGPPVGAAPGGLAPVAVGDRLAAFGFSDAARTRQAVLELTRGFSRSSRMWQQLLPLVLGWLSDAPDPDLGLLGLRSLAAGPHARDQLIATFRESAEEARQLCQLLGTGPSFARDLLRNPDLLQPGSTSASLLATRSLTGSELGARARGSVAWRPGGRGRREGLQALRRSEQLRIAERDVLGGATVERTGHDLTVLAEAVVATAVELVDPGVPLAVVAMGRLGGRELSYASDLDVLLVYDGADPGGTGDSTAAAAEAAAQALLGLLNGRTPAQRVYALDTSLRPEGRQGPVARSLDAYAAYYRRWAHTWERQALLRGRVVAGDAEVGRRFEALAADFVWGRPLGADAIRDIRRTKARMELERIPATEDPQFHLKLGRGSLSDIEWTAQLLQLRHGVAATGTLEALAGLQSAGAIDADDAAVLADAYRFCQHTRNRLTLVRGGAADSLPTAGSHLAALARSLGTTATDLRDEYRRVTRRCRRVVERIFYDHPRGADER